MGRLSLSLVVALALMALAACGAEEKATPPPTAPSAAGARPAWEQEWEKVLAAAKKEGTVAVAGLPGAEIRKAVSELFEKRYGITVEYLGQRGDQLTGRIKTERDAGQYLWDVHFGGTTSIITVLKPMGALAPIEPALIVPEVTDGKNWRDGRLEFGDKDRTLLFMTTYTSEALMVNPSLVKPGDIRSYRDLLDPKWKGKVVAHDPRVSGSGQARFVFYYWNKDLGTDYIRALRDQAEVALLRDTTQELQWLAQGKYAICIGCSTSEAAPMIEAGAPIGVVDARQMKEGGYLTVGGGGLTMFSNAPHPNAAKVYLNWFLSKEGQTEFAKAAGLVSRRLDGPTDHVPPRDLPVAGWSILLDGEEGVLERRVKAQPFFTEVFGRN